MSFLSSSDPSQDVLFISLDSCRYDTFSASHASGLIPNFSRVAPLHKAFSPSHYTYGSHSSFWVGFTPGNPYVNQPLINPKAGKIFRLSYSGSKGKGDLFDLQGSNIVEGFANRGYCTVGTGAVDWFDPSSKTGRLLGDPFHHFYFPGDTFSLNSQLDWLSSTLSAIAADIPRFVFLNIGETHVPYWHRDASWPQRPSPCRPFGGPSCNARLSAHRQRLCLEWVDRQISELLSSFLSGTILICSDHGDCWGEDGLWEHGVSHPMTLTVPLLLRAKGIPVSSD